MIVVKRFEPRPEVSGQACSQTGATVLIHLRPPEGTRQSAAPKRWAMENKCSHRSTVSVNCGSPFDRAAWVKPGSTSMNTRRFGQLYSARQSRRGTARMLKRSARAQPSNKSEKIGSESGRERVCRDV